MGPDAMTLVFRMLSFKPTSAKLWELSSRLGTTQLSRQSRGGRSRAPRPSGSFSASPPPLLSTSSFPAPAGCVSRLPSPGVCTAQHGQQGALLAWAGAQPQEPGVSAPKPTAPRWAPRGPRPGSLGREAGCALGRVDRERRRRDRSKGPVWKLRKKKETLDYSTCLSK